ncbi:hypothetical protein O6H91_17G079000 [Diphasiastrum complanatum]|uniref:Uncharacterized protein n=1 Tax=Diphasiastrum complanatum TaxID=34168 RepID=A0ACC2B8G1_DIPCM|nr:hypothetical protein O6H91_Y208900 [Diphasiastrum complanatum]KAJ7526041.1 hypothetical protein O6H91_17G079000 [Diphasiastrum complanatum]
MRRTRFSTLTHQSHFRQQQQQRQEEENVRVPIEDIPFGQTQSGSRDRDKQEAVGLDHLLNEKTLASLLKRCGQAKALCDGRLAHAHILRHKQNHSRFLSNWLVQMYGDCGSLEEAQAVFDNLRKPNLYSWTVLIKAYTKNGRGREALECFYLLQLEGLKPNHVTYVCAVDACASLAALDKGKQIHAAIIKSGCEGYVNIGTALVNMYGKCGSLQDAKIVFGGMPQKDVVSWNAMICAYARNRKGMDALDCFHQMRHSGLKPSYVTFICALDACAGLTILDKGKEVHALMENGFERQVFVGTALINMYGKCGSVDDARNVFERMASRNVVTWNAMIAAYAQNGQGKEALDCYHQMQREGINPDQITFVSVLSACSHTGGVSEGRPYFLSMIQDYGITPLLEHCMCLVDALGRAGYLDDAEDLINVMPFKTEVVLWSCLLSACRIHGDVERGLRIANHTLKLNPKIAAPYVLLSSMFAAADS